MSATRPVDNVGPMLRNCRFLNVSAVTGDDCCPRPIATPRTTRPAAKTKTLRIATLLDGARHRVSDESADADAWCSDHCCQKPDELPVALIVLFRERHHLKRLRWTERCRCSADDFANRRDVAARFNGRSAAAPSAATAELRWSDWWRCRSALRARTRPLRTRACGACRTSATSTAAASRATAAAATTTDGSARVWPQVPDHASQARLSRQRLPMNLAAAVVFDVEHNLRVGATFGPTL